MDSMRARNERRRGASRLLVDRAGLEGQRARDVCRLIQWSAAAILDRGPESRGYGLARCSLFSSVSRLARTS